MKGEEETEEIWRGEREQTEGEGKGGEILLKVLFQTSVTVCFYNHHIRQQHNIIIMFLLFRNKAPDVL